MILILTTTFKVVAEKPNIIIILADDLDADEINYTSEMHDVWATHSGASLRGLWSKDCNPRVLTPHRSFVKNGMLLSDFTSMERFVHLVDMLVDRSLCDKW